MNPLERKPDALIGHVRFDERGVETECMAGNSGTSNRKGWSRLRPNLHTTAPLLDSTNCVESCFRGKGRVARRDEGAYPEWVCNRGATKPGCLFRENPPGGGPFGCGLRWLGRHSPLRGCSGNAHSRQGKSLQVFCSQRDIVNDKVVLLNHFLSLIFGMRLVLKAKTIVEPTHIVLRHSGALLLKDWLGHPPRLRH